MPQRFAAAAKSFAGLLLLLLLPSGAAAQGASTDSSTPAGLSLSAPAGSSSLTGFDDINLFNGTMKFALPLLTVKGRGAAGHTVLLPVDQRWTVNHYVADTFNEIYGHNAAGYWADFVTIAYSPGRMTMRQSSDNACREPGAQTTSTHTLLTFVGQDGSELDFTDVLKGGGYQTGFCTAGGFGASRGKVFVTRDGTAATFVSNVDIHDNVIDGGGYPSFPSGVLMFRDGTRYGIDNGRVMWVRDRNGNKITFTYGSAQGGPLTKITDSLNREVTFSPEPAQNGLAGATLINYKGLGGAGRTIRVEYKNLGNALRPGYALKTAAQLFGLDNGNYTVDHTVVSSVVLADGASRYDFYYNSYGELARLDLPNGGTVEYDWGATYAADEPSGVVTVQVGTGFGTRAFPEIYRRVLARRVVSAGGAVEAITTFSQTPERHTSTSSVTVEHRKPDAQQTRLSREVHYFHGSPLPYDETRPQPPPSGPEPGREYRTDIFDADGQTLLRRSDYMWERGIIGWNQSSPIYSGPRLTQSLVTLADANLVAKQTYLYDQYNNQTDAFEYDYGVGAPGPLLRHTHMDYVDGAAYTSEAGAHLRSLVRARQVSTVNPDTGAATITAKSETLYDETAYALPNYAADKQPFGWDATVPAQRGNPTTSRAWLDTGSTWLETHAAYDQVGNARKTWDARAGKPDAERVTENHYEDSFAGPGCALAGGAACHTYGFATKTVTPKPDPSDVTEQHASLTPLETSSVYDYSTGLVVASKDANGRETFYAYNDARGRLTRITHPDGGVTAYEYDDTAGNVHTKTLTYRGANMTLPVESRQYFDGLGRPARAFIYDGEGPTHWSVADTHYDSLGRVWKVSKPYGVSTPGATLPDPADCANCTTTVYDALDRVRTVTAPDGSKVESEYAGNTVKVTDPQGKKKKTERDALGRVTKVTEAPDVATCQTTGAGCTTSYRYDALGNLRRVEQGTQTRRFMYDSLSRLVRVKNPEQDDFAAGGDFPALADPIFGGGDGWSLAYLYDANGNLLKRKDARNIITTYGYDNLGRNITVAYAGGTPTTPSVSRYYDAGADGLGRLSRHKTSGAWESETGYAYDAAGRVGEQWQRFKRPDGTMSQPYAVSRLYDKAGNVTHQTYPSGRAVEYPEYDTAGRLDKVTGNLGGGAPRTYADAISYDESGRMLEERFGTQTPLYHKQRYNVRGQLYDVRLSTVPRATSDWDWDRGALTFYYGQHAAFGQSNDLNNGNVWRTEHWIPTNPNSPYGVGGQEGPWIIFGAQYQYDALNRLSSTAEAKLVSGVAGEAPSYAQAYTYDRWGNRQINETDTTGPVNKKLFGLEDTAARNRLLGPNDAAQAESDRQMRYDGAGNLVKDTHSGAGERAYDAENRMVSAVGSNPLTGAFTNQYGYDADGRRVRRVSESGEVWQVYGVDGELVAEYAASGAATAPRKEYAYRGGELLVVAEPAGAASAAPANLAAASGGAAVTLNWGAAAGAVKYRVERSPDKNWSSPTVFSAAAPQTTYADSAAAPGAAYLYRVCAADTSNNCVSAFSNAALGAARAFTDPQIVTYSDHQQGINTHLPLTSIKAEHVTELREAVNAVRQLAGLAPATWAEAELQGALVKADHVNELRTNLNAALGQLGLPAPSYTDATLATGADGTPVKRDHFAELRQAATRGAASGSAGAGAGATGGLRWLVSDHLGTPRMTTDETGSLEGIRRHDYLPFGEELLASETDQTVHRKTAQGYSADGVRQQFTGYERDNETGLDYAQARYYASVQGRFTAVDPLMASGSPAAPQSWNRYAYVQNNPLTFVDPSGMILITGGYASAIDCNPNEHQQQQQQQTGVRIEIKPEQLSGGVFVTQRGEGAAQQSLPVSPEVNAVMNVAVAAMASNIASGMVAADNLERNPNTQQQTSASNSTSVSLQVGTSPTVTAGSQSGNTTQVTASSTDPIVTATRNANDMLQYELARTLSTMSSPTVVNPEGVNLGQAPAGDAANLAVSLANRARTVANDVARDVYKTHYPNRPVPKAFTPSIGDYLRRRDNY